MGPQRSSTPFYTCSFPGCPSPVRVSIPLVASVQDLVRQTDGDLQGILLGARTAAGTEVRSCRPVASFGPEAMGRVAAADRDVVGYYRVRRAETMRLTETEAAVADGLFAKPGSVVLLIQRRDAGAQGNFFFRENGALVNLSLLMFPLDAALLDRRRAAAEQAAAALPSPEDPAAERRSSKLGMAAAIGIMAAGLAGGGWYLRHRELPADASTGPAASAPLPLRAERQGSDLKVMWDLNSAAVANAVSGVLDIDDGGEKRRIPLDARQVRFGSVLYTPKSDEVSIDLTAVKQDGTAGQASVLVLLPRTSTGAPGREVQNIAAAGFPGHSADRRAFPPAPVRPFVPPAEKQEPVAPSHEPENLPAAQLRSQSLAAVQLPAITAPAPPPPAPRTAAAPPPSRVETPAPAPARPSAPAPAYAPPELISQVGARVPPELRSFLTHPINVSVRATVDETGRVVHAESIPEKVIHVGFLSAAAEAAARCRFRPARRGNTPVRGEVILTFRFQPR